MKPEIGTKILFLARGLSYARYNKKGKVCLPGNSGYKNFGEVFYDPAGWGTGLPRWARVKLSKQNSNRPDRYVYISVLHEGTDWRRLSILELLALEL